MAVASRAAKRPCTRAQRVVPWRCCKAERPRNTPWPSVSVIRAFRVPQRNAVTGLPTHVPAPGEGYRQAHPTTHPDMPPISAASLAKLNVHSRITFVKESVEVIPITQQLIDYVMPYFPLSCRVVGGYIDDGDQYWKVNYHWEYLVTFIEKFRASTKPSEELKTKALHIHKVLMSIPPLPERGYMKDKRMGDTKDASPRTRIRERHKILLKAKEDFRLLIIEAGFVDKKTEKANPTKAEQDWWLAVAPVAPPGRSKHGEGYALDIKGNNVETKRIAKLLGATLTFVEGSHVHVEFANFMPMGSLYVPIPGLPGKW